MVCLILDPIVYVGTTDQLNYVQNGTYRAQLAGHTVCLRFHGVISEDSMFFPCESPLQGRQVVFEVHKTHGPCHSGWCRCMVRVRDFSCTFFPLTDGKILLCVCHPNHNWWSWYIIVRELTRTNLRLTRTIDPHSLLACVAKYCPPSPS